MSEKIPPIAAHVSATIAAAAKEPVIRQGHRSERDVEERWEPADEPTRLERIIASQFRRGIVIPLTPRELQAQSNMSLEQRCDYVAKIVVYTARSIERHLRETGKS